MFNLFQMKQNIFFYSLLLEPTAISTEFTPKPAQDTVSLEMFQSEFPLVGYDLELVESEEGQDFYTLGIAIANNSDDILMPNFLI